MLLALALSAALLGAALAVGAVGFRLVSGFAWVDSLHNAASILTGLGPVNPAASTAAKLFATAYALFSSLVFVGVTGIVLAPIFHRVLHRFHLEERDLR